MLFHLCSYFREDPVKALDEKYPVESTCFVSPYVSTYFRNFKNIYPRRFSGVRQHFEDYYIQGNIGKGRFYAILDILLRASTEIIDVS